jgi:uncharacterized protein YegL
MYEQRVHRNNPGLFLILLDQSGSMSDPYGKSTKKEFAAEVINNCIYEIIDQCKKEGKTLRRCQIGVCGYGDQVKWKLAGWVDEIESKHEVVAKDEEKVDAEGNRFLQPIQKAIWIKPEAAGGTPMNHAFHLASELIRAVWLPNCPDSFPPVVINITDGEPSDAPAARKAAKELTDLKTSDGNVLLFNVHISKSLGMELCFPDSLPAGADAFVKFIYEISSKVPDTMRARAEACGLEAKPGSSGCIFNAMPKTLAKMVDFASPKNMQDQR